MTNNSGYHDCPCRDCFLIAIGETDGKPDLCSDCEEAGCSADGDEECQVVEEYAEKSDEHTDSPFTRYSPDFSKE